MDMYEPVPRPRPVPRERVLVLPPKDGELPMDLLKDEPPLRIPDLWSTAHTRLIT